MCGIAGLVDFSFQSKIENIQSMTDVLYHRGPDDGGYFFESGVNSQVGLGHRRLSIIDLSEHGHQPMMFEDSIIVYNGEVYNFKEIRDDLESLGYYFSSDSDTEVVLKAIHCWGHEAVNRFNGMFAIAIFDKKSETLSLIRDRAGVKPLYWYFRDGLFLFSSEMKSFHENNRFYKKISNDALAMYLKYGYVLQPYTIFESAHKLESGSILQLDLNSSDIKIKKYWDVIDCYKQPKLKISFGEAVNQTEEILRTACEYRMVSDVPVGVFLSGGYDSSAVTALLQSNRTDQLKTFSIGFNEPKYNEAQYASEVSKHLGTDHTEYYCTQEDVAKILPRLPEIWDEPFGDSSAIPTTLVSSLARESVTVSLSADGGDEIFGGYNKYTSINHKNRLMSKIPKGLLPLAKSSLNSKITHFLSSKMGVYNAEQRLKRLSLMLGSNDKELLEIGSQVFTDFELRMLLKQDYQQLESAFVNDIDSNWLDNVLATDYKTYQVDDILTKVDRATMSCGLEGREPLLDYNLINFVARLVPDYKIKNGNKKAILKEIVHKYIPKEMMDRPKMGFGIPIFEWLKEDLRDYITHYLSEDRIKDGGLFSVSYVNNLRDNYLFGLDVNINQIWFILMFEMWRERWM